MIRALLLTEQSDLKSRLSEELRHSHEIALQVSQPLRERTHVDHLAATSGATIVIADAELVTRGLLAPRTSQWAADAAELILIVDEVSLRALEAVLASHARGCVDSEASLPAFLRAVHAVAEGELWLPRWMLEILYEQVVADGMDRRQASAAVRHAESGVSGLSSRESEVLQLVKRGLTNKEIARRLTISPSTVKKHLHNALGKRGLFRRRQAYT